MVWVLLLMIDVLLLPPFLTTNHHHHPLSSFSVRQERSMTGKKGREWAMVLVLVVGAFLGFSIGLSRAARQGKKGG